MRIGYSFWGFLGDGIVDTPDGGRSHRRTLLDALTAEGHTIIFLQRDRDRLEAGEPPEPAGNRWDPGLPALDLLFLEWRWPIAGRNQGVDPTHPAYTPDLARQAQLVASYTQDRGTPTLIWDKDLMVGASDPLRSRSNVQILEAALFPRPGAHRLLFPIADRTLQEAIANGVVPAVPERELVYVGNQYGRDDAFDRYVAGPGRELTHAVFGKWPRRERWPHVHFAGRVAFAAVPSIYRRSLATVLLVPDRYAAVGQITQRIFESALSGCVPLGPAEVRGIQAIVPPTLTVNGGPDVVAACRRLAAPGRAAESLRMTIEGLGVFRMSDQLDRLAAAAHAVGALL